MKQRGPDTRIHMLGYAIRSLVQCFMPTSPMLLRAARSDDSATMANLLVQLYHVERPAMLGGPREGQNQLLQYILEADHFAGLHGHYVVQLDDESLVATAGLRVAPDSLKVAFPEGTFRMAWGLLGPTHAIRMFTALYWSMATPPPRLAAHHAYIYSVIVDEHYRRHGIGRFLMHNIEDMARHQGARATLLGVMRNNHQARHFYTHLGYEEVRHDPHWTQHIGLPLITMKKALK